MSVSAGKIHGKASLITDIGTLSWTGTLLDCKNITILWISPSETAWKWNFSNSSVCWLMSTGEAIDGRSCNTARDANTSAALASTEVNSSTMTFISLEYSSCVKSYRGIQFLITFHLELFFWQESSSYWTCFLSASRRRLTRSLRFARYICQSRGELVSRAILSNWSLWLICCTFQWFIHKRTLAMFYLNLFNRSVFI